MRQEDRLPEGCDHWFPHSLRKGCFGKTSALSQSNLGVEGWTQVQRPGCPSFPVGTWLALKAYVTFLHTFLPDLDLRGRTLVPSWAGFLSRAQPEACTLHTSRAADSQPLTRPLQLPWPCFVLTSPHPTPPQIPGIAGECGEYHVSGFSPLMFLFLGGPTSPPWGQCSLWPLATGIKNTT